MQNKIAFTCALIILTSISSPLFPDDQRAAAKNFVMYIEGNYFASAIHTSRGSYLSSGIHEIREISESGKTLWQRRLSILNESDFYWLRFNGIAETDDGYILVGGTYDFEERPLGAIIARLGTDGSIQWSKSFEDSQRYFFKSVSPVADGGYIVHGAAYRSYQDSGTILVKFTSTGGILWSKIFDDVPEDSVSQPSSDGIILASTRSGGIFKVNDSGSIVWKKSLQINAFKLQSLALSSDNGVILAGIASNSRKRLILVRVDSDGNADWTASYQFNGPIGISSLAQTSDGGYVVAGTKRDENYQNSRGFVIKIDSNRELVFRKKFGSSDRAENPGPVFPSPGGGYVIFGDSIWWRPNGGGGHDMLFLNVNSEGIVPDCSFFHKLTVKKVASPVVKSRNLELRHGNISLTAVDFWIGSAVSTNSSFSACP